VLSSVFIPTAFIAGISGEFYRQFALTIATATIISAINAMTMAPARAVALIRPHSAGHAREVLPQSGVAILGGALAYFLLAGTVTNLLGLGGGEHGGHGHDAVVTPAMWAVRLGVFALGAVIGWFGSPAFNRAGVRFFDAFNRGFDRLINVYGRMVAGLVRMSILVLVVYAGLIGLTYLGFTRVSTGFIPEQDKGYLVINAQLPDGASLERTEAVMEHVDEITRATPGVLHTLRVPGYSILTGNNISNVGGMFVILSPFEERVGEGLGAPVVLDKLREQFRHLQEAQVVIFGAPPVDGLGNTGGFKLYVQDRGDLGYETLQEVTSGLIGAAASQPTLAGAFSSFRATQPQLYVDVDRTKAKSIGVPLSDVFETLQVYLGSAYANDFTRFGRNWQVNLQADAPYRIKAEDIGRLKVRNNLGEMIPLATLVRITDTTGPAIVNRYNMFPAAEVNGGPAPGVGSGEAMSVMASLAQQELPAAMGFEWTELALQQILAGNTAVFVFALGALLVFMILAALYESWSLPMAIILIVPMCLLAAIAGVWVVGSDNNIFTQIGLVVLIGLAAKNAILIVEFAKQLEDEGKGRFEAVVEACRVRLRPILMTSFAFILGVVPLITGAGAGAEMRFALGIAVFSGMLGVTLFGVFFTPVFYDVIRARTSGGPPPAKDAHQAATDPHKDGAAA
jgi:multidrug efflux pump